MRQRVGLNLKNFVVQKAHRKTVRRVSDVSYTLQTQNQALKTTAWPGNIELCAFVHNRMIKNFAAV